MSLSRLRILAAITTGLLLTILFLLICFTGIIHHARLSTNPLAGREGMVDRLIFFDSDRAFLTGRLDHLAVVHDLPAELVLDDRRANTFPRSGDWTSPVVEGEFPFTEVIPSWNATTPPNAGLRLALRTRDAGGTWSPWLAIGHWGRTVDPSPNEPPISEFAGGVVHVDNLLLDRPATAFQVRLMLQCFEIDRTINPSVRRITVSYSGQVRDPRAREVLAGTTTIHGQWARDLAVPFRAQGDAPRALRSQICSPTSTTMVMSFWGIDRPFVDNALAIYDEQSDIFGNWGRAVARAGELGLDAWVTRCRDWEQVKSLIAQGQPVIADIAFRRGEFPSSVLKETTGHLLVIRGFKPNGDVICNDPASRDHGNGAIYKADELGRAWFKNAGGVAYIIRKPTTRSASESVTLN